MKLTVSDWPIFTRLKNLQKLVSELVNFYWRYLFLWNTNNINMLNFFSLLQVKQPGLKMLAIQSEMDLSYGQRYQDITIPEAYERLILDTYVLNF